MEWATNNWFVLAVVIYGAASEIIGISPLKDNSVIQVIMSILGKIFGKKD
jgi:hypothetical protein